MNALVKSMTIAGAALALAACGDSGVGMDGGEEGSGGMTGQLRAICVSQIENIGVASAAVEQVCDCASERAREELSVADLIGGDTAPLEDIMTQCADDYLGIGASSDATPGITNEAETL